jgi:hypothetical protein
VPLVTLEPLTATTVAAELSVAEPLVPAVKTPLADAAAAFLAEGVAHFATPGHERNPALVGDDCGDDATT